jgi:hypothetical protein
MSGWRRAFVLAPALPIPTLAAGHHPAWGS